MAPTTGDTTFVTCGIMVCQRPCGRPQQEATAGGHNRRPQQEVIAGSYSGTLQREARVGRQGHKRPRASLQLSHREKSTIEAIPTLLLHRLTPIFTAHLCPIQPLWGFHSSCPNSSKLQGHTSTKITSIFSLIVNLPIAPMRSKESDITIPR